MLCAPSVMFTLRIIGGLLSNLLFLQPLAQIRIPRVLSSNEASIAQLIGCTSQKIGVAFICNVEVA